ncbi:tectonic-2 isoform 2-T2 [Anableps anableps]
MANIGLLSASISVRTSFILFLVSFARPQNIVVFQPSFLISNGPKVSAFLLGNTSRISLNLKTVSASNTTGSIGSSSCVPEATRWALTTEQMGKSVVRVHLTLNQSLHLCSENETNADCCPKPLCVLETLQVSACLGSRPLASLLIQATINAWLFPPNAGSDNKTVFPNQVYQPLGVCPCDLTHRACDTRCCCDQDCSNEDLKLFASHCLPGPFGGEVSPTPDYQCSVQSVENSPDWFPFLCVSSSPENNPYLGLFYQGDTIAPRPGPSFQMPVLSAPVPVSLYIQGSPIVTSDHKYFTIPQMVLGRCITAAPVAFLQNFKVECVTFFRSCPTGPPLKMLQEDLSTDVLNGQGGVVKVNLTDVEAPDLSLFLSSGQTDFISLDYKFYWKGNGITSISLTRTVQTVVLNGSLTLTTRYSAVFLNGESMAEPNSGNPGYQVGRPVIAGILDNNTELIQRSLINIWKPVGDGLCSSANMKPVVFGENSTSGCLLPIGQQNMTQCDLLREIVADLQTALTTATYVAQRGNPKPTTMTDWLNISFVTPNISTEMGATAGVCRDIPSHQHISVWSLTTSLVDGIPQREIQALEVSYGMSTWALDCGGGDVSLCEDLEESQLFPVTSSVTFIDIPVNTGPPKTRFQINFTEYDCNRNDVCWPELAFPFTRYYTGEPYSQSLAKGMILVFMFLTAAILGTPWRQIRQAWHNI